jgi:hypothetical protein
MGATQEDLARTRYSQVTHYFFENCCYYTPMGSAPFLGKLQPRNITDISTGQTVPNMLNGVAVDPPVHTNPVYDVHANAADVNANAAQASPFRSLAQRAKAAVKQTLGS